MPSDNVKKLFELAKSFAAGFPSMGGPAFGMGAIAKPQMAPNVKSTTADKVEDKVFKLKQGRDSFTPKKSGLDHLKKLNGMTKIKPPGLQSGPMMPRQNNKPLNSEV
jgi:hypothetical protein